MKKKLNGQGYDSDWEIGPFLDIVAHQSNVKIESENEVLPLGMVVIE